MLEDGDLEIHPRQGVQRAPSGREGLADALQPDHVSLGGVGAAPAAPFGSRLPRPSSGA